MKNKTVFWGRRGRASRAARLNYRLEKACRQVFPQLYFGLSKTDLQKLKEKQSENHQ